MTILFAISCFAIAFSPALMIFIQIVTKDPLRVILFFLGSFFWLLSVLLSGLFALPFSSIVPFVFVSALIQEGARAGYFALLHRAQKDLERVAANGVEVSNLKLSFASRHVLAVVCGLGIGVTAALFLLVNVLADYSTEGVVGLPASVTKADGYLDVSQAAFPILYSLSNGFLILDHVIWTLILWDALHNYVHSLQSKWWISAVLIVVLHLLNNFVSLNAQDSKIHALFGQFFILAISAFYAFVVIRKPNVLRSFSNFMGISTPTRSN
ncbi:hypothetical protein M3Y97_00359900 [Aphelenchoides bicaudatus]|nr:hypothetical protein M3Y97_00359900 [Aphelenchoides bicaudatus]